MGKRIIQRARGKGGPRYKAPSHRFKGKVSYNLSPDVENGVITDIVHDPGRNAPLMLIEFPDGSERFQIAPEGVKVGDLVKYGSGLEPGSVLPINKVTEGTRIFGIETYPGSGPKLCRSSGSFATVLGKVKDKIRIKLSSGKTKEIDKKCLVSIGIPAGGGRKEKPWVKAGKKHYAKKARNKLYPITSGVKMNPVDHPFGGKTKPGIPKSVSKNAPPGRKVGSLSSKRTGRKKRK
ncbi:MAG: 50S ribosomal protein L2 [Candidatus Aenigmarchaeota archaeon]|nr:50S ribosomal protein L2 [Candidatus Aenigmarchaeota archaeon]